MSSIHYFQRYSQPENVDTNNTLLLLSRLYHESPNKFKAFLNDLLNDYDIEAGIQFNQQTKEKDSIPDGSLSQMSFKIVVETKRHERFSIDQLNRHLNSFGDEQYKVLLSLSPNHPDNTLKSKIENAVNDFNKQSHSSIKYLPITFQRIIETFKNSLDNRDYTLFDVINDFEEYCMISGLIIEKDGRMRVVPCGWTLQENLDFDLYYAPAKRGFSEHTYLGLYSQKSIQAIGKIVNIITANRLADDQLDVLHHTEDVTDIQKQNILDAMKGGKKNYRDITTGYSFFCVERFYGTDFQKSSKYPLQGTKFFDLKELLNLETLPPTEEIAKRLKGMKWE